MSILQNQLWQSLVNCLLIRYLKIWCFAKTTLPAIFKLHSFIELRIKSVLIKDGISLKKDEIPSFLLFQFM